MMLDDKMRLAVTRQNRSVFTKKLIFDSAATLFAIKGYRCTTIREIAAAAAVNPALISYHFQSKASLYDQILGEALEHATSKVAEIEFDAGAPDAEHKLIAIFAHAF